MNKEVGRSMVEMLGVLALVGILSIGAVAGYRYAINKYAANVTQDELTKWAMVYASQLVKNDTLDTSEMGSVTKMKYWIAARISSVSDDYFVIALSNVPPEVCKHLLKNNWQFPVQIIAGGFEYRGNSNICGKRNTTLDYLFYADLQGLGEETDCPKNSRCGEVCCDAGTVCDINGKTCVPPDNKECVTNDDCGKEGNGRYFCNKVSISNTQEKETGTCQKVSYATKTSKGIKFYLSDSSFNWFNANRFCQALGMGKRLVNKPVEFGCPANVITSCGTPNTACHNQIFLELSDAWSTQFWTENYVVSSCYYMTTGSGCGVLCGKGTCSYRALCR